MAKLRVLDLFCGAAGGWSLGLHRTGCFKTVAACEADPWRRERFLSNNPGVRMYDDVRTLTAERLRSDGIVPDVIVGSPPCQDASASNSRGVGIDGERTGLFFEAIRLVGECRPRWALFENSPALRVRGYDRVHDALEVLGYAVWPHVVGSIHSGAQHWRKRLWIVAHSPETRRAEGVRASTPPIRHEARRVELERHSGVPGGPRRPLEPGICRQFDGVPSRSHLDAIAAYGDAVDPNMSMAWGLAILAAEAAETQEPSR